MLNFSFSFPKDVKRRYENVLDLGSGPGHLAKLLEPEVTKKVTMIDLSGKLPAPG